MAKKSNFNLMNIVDESLLDSLKGSDETKSISPTEKEVELVKTGKGDVIAVPIKNLVDYHNHSYKVLDNEDMATLVDSIKDYGIILPLIVRELNGGKYEVVSGHRRKFAAEKLKLKEVPCKVMDLDDDMADIVMADTNIARETILPSERAKTYKVRLDAAVRQGKKTVEELKNIAEDAPDSVRQIQRYLKLNDLDESLLDRVDAGEVPVTAGVILSGLSPEHQRIVSSVSERTGHAISLKDSEKLKTAEARGLTRETVESILSGDLSPRKAPAKKKETFKEESLFDVLPDEIKNAPLNSRIDYYKKAIVAYQNLQK